MEVFDAMRVEFGQTEVKKKIHLDNPDLLQDLIDKRLQDLIERVLPGIIPRAVYKAGYLDSKQEDGVVLDGVGFQSRALRKNLEEVGRIFPFVLPPWQGNTMR